MFLGIVFGANGRETTCPVKAKGACIMIGVIETPEWHRRLARETLSPVIRVLPFLETFSFLAALSKKNGE